MGKLISMNTFPTTLTFETEKKSPTGIPIFNKRNIVPGTNIIPDAELEEILSKPFVKEQIKLGNYSIDDTTVELTISKGSKANDAEKAATELSQMTVKEAKLIISGDPKNKEDNGILDISVLKAVMAMDNRTGMQNACKEQIDILYQRDEE